VEGDGPVDRKTLLVTKFINLKIKPTQSFGGTHRSRVCMCVFIRVSAHTCMSIYICTVFLKKKYLNLFKFGNYFIFPSKLIDFSTV
jgi:hypothetical protein